MDQVVRLMKAKDVQVTIPGRNDHSWPQSPRRTRLSPKPHHYGSSDNSPSPAGSFKRRQLRSRRTGKLLLRETSLGATSGQSSFCSVDGDSGNEASQETSFATAIDREQVATNKLRKLFNLGEQRLNDYRSTVYQQPKTLYARIRRWRIPGITDNQRAFFVLSKDNFIRKSARAIIEWSPFEWLVLGTIIANCVVLGMEQRLPRDDKTPLSLVAEETEAYFLLIFSIEAVCKMTALGLIFDRGAYMRNMWNVLDFVVVVTGLIPFVFSHSKLFNLRILRAVRVLRPLKLVSGIPSLQVVLSSIIRAMAPLIQIALLVLFAILIFAIIGLEFYSGIFHQTCMNPWTDGTDFSTSADVRPCSHMSLGHQCPTTNNQTLFCLKYWVGPNHGITSFDNIGFAMLTVFQCITMEGWTNIMYWTNDATGSSTSWIFYVPLIIVGSFFMLNLVLGVLSGEFARERKRVEKRRRFMRMRRQEHMQKELDNYVDWITAAEDAILNQDQSVDDDEKLRIIESRRRAAARHLHQMRRRQKQLSYGGYVNAHSVESICKQAKLSVEDDFDDCAVYEDPPLTDTDTGSKIQPPATMASTVITRIPLAQMTPGERRRHFQHQLHSSDHFSLQVRVKKRSWLYKMFGCGQWTKSQKRLRVKLRLLVKTEAWFWTVIAVVFINSFCLAIEHYNQPEWLTSLLYYSEFVFATLFIVETSVPLYAFGPRIFFLSAFRVFDTMIILGSLIEVILGEFRPEKSFGISVMRSVRLLRIFKLTRYWLSLRNLVLSLYNSMRSIISLLFLLFLFVLIFAMLGMQIFGGRWNFPEGRPSANFDSLPIAMMTVFQILTGEDWNEVLYCGIRSMGGVDGGGMIFSFYFVLLVLFGNYTLLNVFLAIAVDNLSSARELTALEQADIAHSLKTTAAGSSGQESRNNNEDVRILIEGDEVVDKTGQDSSTGPQPMLQVSTFFILGPENATRRFCHYIVNLRYFDLFIMITIGASSLALAAEDPIDESADRNKILAYFDYVFTAIFTVEMLLKMIDLGLFLHEGAYFRDLWNVLDALVVICAPTGFAIMTYGELAGVSAGRAAAGRNLNTIKAFRALRVLRPLKTINRVPKLKAVFSCVLNSLKDVTNILIVYFLFQFIFSCVAVQLFKGKFFYCTDPSKITPDDCQGDFFVYDLKSALPRVERRLWKQNDFHYDNLLSAMLTLFTVTTGEGWPLVLKNSMDSTHEGIGPQPGHSTETAVFYIAFFIVFPFFFINIFVALIIITFQEQGESELAGHKLDKNQKRCIEFAINARPLSRHMPSKFRSFRFQVWRLVDSTIFEYFIMAIICLNTVVLMMKTKHLDEEKTAEVELYEFVLSRVNLIFTLMFSLEAILKLIAFTPRNYLRDPWNAFDFLIVVGSIADIAVQEMLFQGQNSINLSFLRLFRAARLIKLLRLGGTIRVLLWTFIQSCKALPWVFLLLGMLFFIYAIIGMQVFGNIALDEATQINRHNNFQNFFTSLLLLFRCATGEAWQQIMLACFSGRPCDPLSIQSHHATGTATQLTCGQDFIAYAYFVSFVFLSTFLMLNLFIAVIMDNFDYLTRDSSILGPHHLEEYIRAWAEYDPDATGRVHYSDMFELLKTIEPPLGFGNNCPARFAFRKLIRMNAPLDEDKTVHFNTTLFGLIRESLKIKLDVAEKMDDMDRELRATIKTLWPYESKKMIDLLVPLPTVNSSTNGGKNYNITIGKIYSGVIILDNWRQFRRRRIGLDSKLEEQSSSATALFSQISRLNDQLRFDVDSADEEAAKAYCRFQRRLSQMSFMRTMADPRASSPVLQPFPSIYAALATGAWQALATTLPMETLRHQSMDRGFRSNTLQSTSSFTDGTKPYQEPSTSRKSSDQQTHVQVELVSQQTLFCDRQGNNSRCSDGLNCSPAQSMAVAESAAPASQTFRPFKYRKFRRSGKLQKSFSDGGNNNEGDGPTPSRYRRILPMAPQDKLQQSPKGRAYSEKGSYRRLASIRMQERVSSDENDVFYEISSAGNVSEPLLGRMSEETVIVQELHEQIPLGRRATVAFLGSIGEIVTSLFRQRSSGHEMTNCNGGGDGHTKDDVNKKDSISSAKKLMTLPISQALNGISVSSTETAAVIAPVTKQDKGVQSESDAHEFYNYEHRTSWSHHFYGRDQYGSLAAYNSPNDWYRQPHCHRRRLLPSIPLTKHDSVARPAMLTRQSDYGSPFAKSSDVNMIPKEQQQQWLFSPQHRRKLPTVPPVRQQRTPSIHCTPPDEERYNVPHYSDVSNYSGKQQHRNSRNSSFDYSNGCYFGTNYHNYYDNPSFTYSGYNY